MSFFAKLKERVKNEARERTYYNQLLTSVCSMFKWNGLPKTTGNVDFSRFFERYLHQTGCLAVIPGKPKDGSGWFVIPEPSFSGDLDQFGWGTKLDGPTRNGEYQLIQASQDDAIVCWNNSNRIPDFELIEYAYALREIDKAILVNTKLSGFAPLFDAADQKTANAINEILTSLYNGEIKAISSENIKEALLGGSDRSTLSIDTITPQRVQYVQYLSQLWDNFVRRFYNLYGVDITNVNKQAQVNTEELNGWSGYAEILKNDMLRERQDFCERVNARYGTEWSVELQTPYKQETEQYENASADAGDAGNPDGAGTEAGQDSGETEKGDGDNGT